MELDKYIKLNGLGFSKVCIFNNIKFYKYIIYFRTMIHIYLIQINLIYILIIIIILILILIIIIMINKIKQNKTNKTNQPTK